VYACVPLRTRALQATRRTSRNDRDLPERPYNSTDARFRWAHVTGAQGHRRNALAVGGRCPLAPSPMPVSPMFCSMSECACRHPVRCPRGFERGSGGASCPRCLRGQTWGGPPRICCPLASAKRGADSQQRARETAWPSLFETGEVHVLEPSTEYGSAEAARMPG
jgi:hypothetical protein